MIEYLEDLIEVDPYEEFPQDVQESGRFVTRTGDALLDQWQEKAATGEKIDFDEAFLDPEALKQFEAIKERSRRKHQVVPASELPEDINDDYAEDDD